MSFDISDLDAEQKRIRAVVVIESPYAGNVALNRAYLQEAILDCLERGESPYASHQMLTDALDDLKPVERARGIAAGLYFREVLIGAVGAPAVYYTDLGWSVGMLAAKHAGRGEPISRKLSRERLLRTWERFCDADPVLAVQVIDTCRTADVLELLEGARKWGA